MANVNKNEINEALQNLKEVWEKAQITEDDYQMVADHGKVDSGLLDKLEGLLKDKSGFMDQAKTYIDKLEELTGKGDGEG